MDITPGRIFEVVIFMIWENRKDSPLTRLRLSRVNILGEGILHSNPQMLEVNDFTDNVA